MVERIAERYLHMRDVIKAAGGKKGVTASALTNEDAAAISSAIRERLKARGEIDSNEAVYRAVDQRGEVYDLAIARGDKLRLFRKTRIDGKRASIGNNGDVVEVLGRDDAGLFLRNRDGLAGHVAWSAAHGSVAPGGCCSGTGIASRWMPRRASRPTGT